MVRTNTSSNEQTLNFKHDNFHPVRHLAGQMCLHRHLR